MTGKRVPSLPYAHVVQAARAFRPSDLVPAIAARAVCPTLDLRFEDIRETLPHTLAALARDSIVYGNEHRARPLTQADLDRLVALAANAFVGPDGDAGGLAEILGAMAFDQLPFQESRFQELSRAFALFEQTDLPATSGPDVVRWQDTLGMPLRDAIAATLFLVLAVNKNQGRFDFDLLDHPGTQAIYKRVSRANIETTVQRLSATPDQIREEYERAARVTRGRERYAYNPLARTPLVDFGGGLVVAPQPAFIPGTVTPNGLYFVGLSAWGTAFTEQMGDRVQEYVGRLLRSVPGLDVHADFTFDRDSNRPIDWFAITDDAVLLVECKLRRTVVNARAGGDALLTEYVSRLNHGREQLNTTVEHIRQGHPAFSFVPTDRPILGMVVTAEPFHLANTDEVTAKMTPTTIPSIFASLQDLEILVRVKSQTITQALAEVLNDADRRTWSLQEALRDKPKSRNSVLDAAWSSMSLTF